MREIKFRLRKKRSRKIVAAIHLGNDYGYILETTGEGGSFALNEKNLIWEQFSGLKDINGTDIFEADVVDIAGYGEYEVAFPFSALYEAKADGNIGSIVGDIYKKHKIKKESK